MGFDRWGDSTHKMTAFRHFSESTELDLSFNELTEVRAGMWKVSNRWGESTHKMTAFRHFSESTELDLSFNDLTEVRAGMWEVSDDSIPDVGLYLTKSEDCDPMGLTEVRAGMWEVSDKVAISCSAAMYFLSY